MVKVYNEELGKMEIDKRHCVDIINLYSFAKARMLNSDGTYEDVCYMDDDVRTYNNEAIIDATKEELETYRKYMHRFEVGDKVIINRGRKMKGETKIIKDFFTYRPAGTYNCDTNYLVFTDGTKVNRLHCDIL